MPAMTDPTPLRQRGEQVAAALIPLTAAAAVSGRVAPESLGMAPLIGALVLLFLGSLRREPLSGGLFVVLMLSLRVPLHGEDRYLPQELVLTDVLMVMSAVAAAFSASRAFWRTFQTLFAIVIPLAGAWAWGMGASTGADQPFAAGLFTAPQSALMFGLSLCYALARLRARLAGGRGWAFNRRILSLALWMVCALLAGGLALASGGMGSLSLVGAAVWLAWLSGQIHSVDPERGRGIWVGGLLAGLLLTGTAAAVFMGPAPPLVAWGEALRQRLSLLACFFQAPFRKVEWWVHGVGFTNSSEWLCQSVRPGERMIHADNLLAQLAADTGMISLLVLGCLLIWMMRRMWRLSARVADPVVLASLMGALYMLLEVQTETGWSQSTVIQVLMGLQVAALCLPLETPR
jgi:hypothetical protein